MLNFDPDIEKKKKNSSMELPVIREATKTQQLKYSDWNVNKCNQATSNWTLECRFNHMWFFPALLWSCDFAPASGVYKCLQPSLWASFSEAR